jgi:hypothetical protein
MPPTDYLLEAATQHYAYGYTEVGYTHSITDGRKLSRFAQTIMPGLDMLPQILGKMLFMRQRSCAKHWAL